MTERISAYTVFLTKDVREDDAEAIAAALRMVKGVMRVTSHVADPSAAVIAMRVARQIEERVMFAIREGNQ